MKSDKKFQELKKKPEKTTEKTPKQANQEQKNESLNISDSSFRKPSEEEKLLEISMENAEAILFKKEMEARKAALKKKGTKDEEDSPFISIEMDVL